MISLPRQGGYQPAGVHAEGARSIAMDEDSGGNHDADA
jgi:hypothetical protein